MNFGWLKGPPAWKKGPLITEDGNCVSHVYWRSGALADSMGVAWTMVGTVPQVGAKGKIPPGAGPFSAGNYYKTTLVADVYGFAGDFTIYIVFLGWAAGVGRVISTGKSDGTTGFACYLSATDNVYLRWPGVGNTLNGAGGFGTSPNVNVVTIGRQGGVATTGYLKLNNTATSSGTVVNSPDATVSTFLGIYSDGADTPLPGTLLEVYGTTTAFSEANVTAILAQIKAKTGNTAW